MHFLDVVVRQAHPGADWPTYHTFEEKLLDARRYVREEGIPWPVIVDDLEGTVHQAYGGMADPTYLIDTAGRVSLYQLWTYAPVLHEAVEQLLEQGGRGIAMGGVDRMPHFGPALTAGWRGLKRGFPRSVVEMEMAGPGSAVGVAAGRLLKPVVGPLTLRAKPLSREAKIGLAVGAAGLAFLGTRALLRRRGEG